MIRAGIYRLISPRGSQILKKGGKKLKVPTYYVERKIFPILETRFTAR